MVAGLSLAACSPAQPPAVDTMPPPGLADRFYPPRGWTWGKLEVPGAPTLRYGVGSPTSAVRADILILPREGEPIEAWFETINALIADGYNVWALDLAGQGGSGRYPMTRGRLHAPSFDPDVAAVKRLVAEVARPRAPLIVIGEGLGGQIGLRALEEGLPAAGAVFANPSIALTPFPLPMSAATSGKIGRVLNKARIGFVPIPRAALAAVPGDPDRDQAAAAWLRSNPQLAAGGPSWGWLAAYQDSALKARDPGAQSRVKVPVVVFGDGLAAAACEAPACELMPSPAGPVHRGRDEVRQPWLEAVKAMIAARTEGFTVAAPPVGKKRPPAD